LISKNVLFDFIIVSVRLRETGWLWSECETSPCLKRILILTVSVVLISKCLDKKAPFHCTNL